MYLTDQQRNILAALKKAKRPLSSREIMARVPGSSQVIYRHLRVLHEAKLVRRLYGVGHSYRWVLGKKSWEEFPNVKPVGSFEVQTQLKVILDKIKLNEPFGNERATKVFIEVLKYWAKMYADLMQGEAIFQADLDQVRVRLKEIHGYLKGQVNMLESWLAQERLWDVDMMKDFITESEQAVTEDNVDSGE